ncbi:MAG: hypothetical protein WKF34_11725 [Pyrinomonadaceae bacterium]
MRYLAIKRLDDRQVELACVALARDHPELAVVYRTYGAPPLWARPTGFATLLNIILEQQVSLASAKACFDKLACHVGDVTPVSVLELSDADLRTVGFSRQKTAYARHLAAEIIHERMDLVSLDGLPDAEVKAELLTLKGVGEWTAGVYMLMAMLRPDVMPRGDIALHAAYQKLTGADMRPGSDEFIAIAERWRPFRSVAARLLWHFYLSERPANRNKAR